MTFKILLSKNKQRNSQFCNLFKSFKSLFNPKICLSLKKKGFRRVVCFNRAKVHIPTNLHRLLHWYKVKISQCCPFITEWALGPF